MPTIQDVAKLAQVSPSSVSNALNGRTQRMRKETFQRIQKAIAQLNYQPNKIARHLKTGQLPILGMLVPSTANPLFGELAVAIETVAQKQYNYRLLVCNTQRDISIESAMLDDLISLGIKAVIVNSSMAETAHLLLAAKRGITIISYDTSPRQPTNLPYDHIYPDSHKTGWLAAKTLIDQGHRQLALVKPEGATISRQDKTAGFIDAAHAAPHKVSTRIIKIPTKRSYGDSELGQIGFDAATKIAASQPIPTGVVAINDMIAIGLMAGLRHHHLQVPKDISVIGMDNIPTTEFTWPPLTTIAMPVQAMAQTIVERALQRLENPTTPPNAFRFEPTLLVRQSVSSPPIPHEVS